MKKENTGEHQSFEEDPFRLNNFLYGLEKEEQERIKRAIIKMAEEGDVQSIKGIVWELDRRSKGQNEGKEESKGELLPEELPVIIHRWFPNGEGFAYHPSMVEDFQSVVDCIDDVLKYGNRKGERGKKEFLNKGWIVYIMRPDLTTQDPKAKNRSPFYLTIAIIYGEEPKGEMLEEIYRQIESLPEVESNGPYDKLIINR